MPDSSSDALPGMGPDAMADTETRWLSYDDLAKALGITPDSARRLVARKRWPRKSGNDGRALIAVPVERLLQPGTPPGLDATPDISPDDISPVSPDVLPNAGDDITPVVRVLSQHIERLEKQLEAAWAELSEERARTASLALQAAQVDALNAILEVERRRVDDLKAERERWATQAERLALTVPQPAPAPPASVQMQSRSWWPFWRRSA
jgi:hypothetical protein